MGIKRWLDKILEGHKGEPPKPKEPEVRTAKRVRPDGLPPVLLVIDDDAAIRKLVARGLGDGYRVFEAADGLAAAELLSEIPRPQLIICDVSMPRVDGFTFARRLRQDPLWKDIPLLFLTGRTEPADVIQGLDVGARHYLSKPFKLKELAEKVSRAVDEPEPGVET